MSLDFNWKNIANPDHFPYREIHGENYLNDRLEAVIFATIAVDIGEITEKNADEFWKRYSFHRAAMKSVPYLTEEDIHAAVGLWTNVTTRTREEWLPGVWSQAHGVFGVDPDPVAEQIGYCGAELEDPDTGEILTCRRYSRHPYSEHRYQPYGE